METHSDQMFSNPPLSADNAASTDFPYISDPSSHIPLSGAQDHRPLFIILETLKGPFTVPPIPSVIKSNHREHLEWRPGSYGLGQKPRDPREANIPDRSIQILLQPFICAVPSHSSEPMGSEINLIDAVGARAGRLIELCGHVHGRGARSQFFYWRKEHYNQSILNRFYRK